METKKIFEISRSDLNPIGFINQTNLNQTLDRLFILKPLIDELSIIINDNVNIDFPFKSKVTEYENKILGYIKEIEEENTKDASDVIARKKDAILNDINNYCNSISNINNKESIEFYLVYNTIKNFSKGKFDKIEERINITELEIKDLLEDINGLKENYKFNVDESATILDELKKKTAEQSVSDYATVFETEASNKNRNATWWLVSGSIFIAVFITFMLIISFCELLPSEDFYPGTSISSYKISNIITKLVLIAIQIFLISFSFRQYNINKHLSTINKHRQNALNSYKLFTKSIIGNDDNSQNALMIQVAKAIYEQNQTGFLNKENNQGINSGIIELTKIIGANKPA